MIELGSAIARVALQVIEKPLRGEWSSSLQVLTVESSCKHPDSEWSSSLQVYTVESSSKHLDNEWSSSLQEYTVDSTVYSWREEDRSECLELDSTE